MKHVSVRLPDDLAAFLERKKAQMRRQAPPGKEEKISTSRVVEGLIAFWRAFDMTPDEENKHKDYGQGNEEIEEDEPETGG